MQVRVTLDQEGEGHTVSFSHHLPADAGAVLDAADKLAAALRDNAGDETRIRESSPDELMPLRVERQAKARRRRRK